MTAQTTYESDDGQLAQEHDQVILKSNLMEPVAHLAEPAAHLAAPAADPMAPDLDMAAPAADPMAPDLDMAAPAADPMAPDLDMAEPDSEQTGLEDPTSRPAGVTALPDQESATPIVSGFTSDDDGAEEPGTADSSPSLVSLAFTVPEPITESDIAGHTASARGPWNEIQAMFVDDPRASVERAAGLVNDQVEALIQSFMERQRSAQSAWEADDAGTEELRVALQHYRTFWSSMVDFSPQA
jgi:hypothetical protein